MLRDLDSTGKKMAQCDQRLLAFHYLVVTTAINSFYNKKVINAYWHFIILWGSG